VIDTLGVDVTPLVVKFADVWLAASDEYVSDAGENTLPDFVGVTV
jgi:hypothetical protein